MAEYLLPDAEFKQLYGPYFTYGEFCCKCEACVRARVTAVPDGPFTTTGDDRTWFRSPEFKAFMELLINMREALGWPFQINSGFRCSAYNDSLYTGDGTHLDGPHTFGAADVGCAFERAYQLINLATSREMGVGPTQHGPVADRFVHVDNQGPRIWTY